MDKERQYRNLFAQHQRSGSICGTIQVRTLVFPGACVRKYVVERKSQQTQRTTGQCSIACCLTYSDVTLRILYFQRQHHCRLDNRRNKSKKILIKTILARNLLCICTCICQWYDAEKLVPTPRRSEDEEEIDLDREQLTRFSQKERNMARARCDSLLNSLRIARL